MMKDELHIYLRVSSETQMTDGFGLENQREVGLKVCENLGMEPIIYNEGFSSSHSETIDGRPKLKELLLNVEDGRVKNLWVYQMDRLSRNDVVSFQIRQSLKKNGVRLFVNTSNDYSLDNPSDKLMFTIFEGISEFDNSIRTERLRRGKLQKVRNGGWKGGPPPFGYGIKEGSLVPNSSEKRWVKKIYEEYSNGKSIYEIKKLLMKNGVLSRRGNLIWSDQSIRKILVNTHYEGYHIYTDHKLEETVRSECPKILSSSLVKKVRNRLSNSSFKSNYQKTETLLKEFLVCGHCGSKFGQRINKTKYVNHYYCRGNGERLRTSTSDDLICTMDGGRVRSVFIDDTDDLVWNNVVDVVEQSHLFKEIFKTDTMKSNSTTVDRTEEIKRLKNRIKKNDRLISEINDHINTSIVESVLDKDSQTTQKDLIKKFEQKRTELSSENEELKTQIYEGENSKKWVDWVLKFKDRISELRSIEKVNERKTFLKGLIDNITITTLDDQTHSVSINFLSPYVNDGFEWKDSKNKSKGYNLKEGSNSVVKNLMSINRNSKKKLGQNV